MPVSEFRDTFVRLCKDIRTEPQDCVLHAIKSAQGRPQKSGGGRLLSLATHSLTVNSCAVLGKALATDRCFTEICFNDCMLAVDGVRALANGLASNVACKKLDLKGNNIRGTAIEVMGRMLRENNSLLSLSLEWNAMGMLDTAFGVFCEGLSSNATLQILDLRNNQITHEGATQLGAALKLNTTLRALDLQWNNIGLIGGRHLLHCLQTNKTVVRLDLAGNNIPNDVMKSIDTCIAHNAELGSLENDHHTRQHMLSKQIQNLKKDKVSEVDGLLTKMDLREKSMRATHRSFNTKIINLQDALEERRDQFNTVASKLAMAESEIALSESRVNELSSLLDKAREQAGENGKLHQLDLKREREMDMLTHKMAAEMGDFQAKHLFEVENVKAMHMQDRAVKEGKFNKELMDVNERNMQLSNKIDDLEMKGRGQQEIIFDLKEQLGHAHADYKMKSVHFDERVTLEKQKSKEMLRDFEEMKLKEIERVKGQVDDTERSMMERASRMENQKRELEDEVTRLKAANKEARVQSDHELHETTRRIKAEEEARVRELEDKVRALTATKDELHSHSSTQLQNMSELQGKNSNLSLENETQRVKISDLSQQVAGKNAEIMAEVGKVQIEMNQRIQKLETERQTKSELYDRIAKLEDNLRETNGRLTTVTTAKDAEINQLNEKLRNREQDLCHMREEESQRAAVLSAAIQNYINRPPHHSSD